MIMPLSLVYQPSALASASPWRLLDQQGQEISWANAFLDAQRIRQLSLRSLRAYFYCVINYRRKEQHNGQHGSRCTRNRAIWIRSVAIEWGLCRWARTLRSPRPELGRYPGRA